MSKTVEERLCTPVMGEYDVIVVGGGPAGVGAAVASARAGMATLLVERFSCLGGMWTTGLVNPLYDYENKGGIVQEIVNLLNDAKMSTRNGHYYTFDMEYMKLLLDRLTLKSGADVLFHTAFARPLMEGNTVTGIVVENKGGREAYLAKRVIDCTGDGDVAARAGAPFKVGRPGDSACQPMTLMYKLSQMDYIQRYVPNPYGSKTDLYHLIKDSLKEAGINDYEFNFEQPTLLKLPGAHTGVMQMTHMRGYSSLDPRDLTKAEIEGRERVWHAVNLMKKYVEQFEHVQLDQTASMIGIRESRHIQGEYEVTFDDMKVGRHFEDGFATCTFGIDIHQPDGKTQEPMVGVTIAPYQLPYRSLVPLKIDNLLTAGRCISGSFEAHASYRVTGDCVAMGQAAGTAMALSIRNNITPRELDGRLLVKQLEKDGAKV